MQPICPKCHGLCRRRLPPYNKCDLCHGTGQVSNRANRRFRGQVNHTARQLLSDLGIAQRKKDP